jgi:signal transduction histidine kinase
MENWVIGVRFIVVFYCVFRYVTGDIKDIPLVVLSILLYISASMLFHIFRRPILKSAFLLSAFAVLVVSAAYLNTLFIFLLPVTILELAGCYTRDIKLWAAVALLSALPCPSALLAEYLLVDLLSLAVFVLAYRAYTSTAALKKENDRLRERNDSLYGRLDQGAMFEGQVKYLSQLEERNSLAQSIHDKVGHTLAGSLIQLEAASMIMENDREKALAILNGVISHLKEGMESIRSTLRNIKPAPEQLGINRLKVILDEFSLNNPIKTALSYKGSLDAVTNAYWKIIMENVKEALTNALKYSFASSLGVRIEVLNRLVKIEIKDNGAGALTFKKGLGITGMEERTEAAGGKLIIDGSSGFSIIMLLPVGEAANADKSINSR